MLPARQAANALGDAALAARVIPNASHAVVPRGLQRERDPRDVIPTTYCCNRPRRLRIVLLQCGFTAYVHGHAAEPAYLGFSLPTYALGVVWARVAPSILLNTLLDFAERARR